MAKRKEYRLSVWQEDVEVAAVSGPDFDRVHADAMHYAMVYAQDGPADSRDEAMAKFREAWDGLEKLT
jgi:hypothetical protein